MSFMSKLKDLFKRKDSSLKKEKELPDLISVQSMEMKYEKEDYIGAARDLKSLLEAYGRRKSKNHHYKGRVFISFILSNKHQDLKNVGYTHWENLIDFIKLNHVKVYPYHKNNLRNAMTFFEKEVKGLYDIKMPNNQ
ncbi:MAG: hypothetical protein CVV56_08580 [Tenericutes bacterium HGW-Tenericutes-1]|jgi:hypothetical protein|nr:MAG: hypothetical protein CVV56_08580 [Tenericutes bacterium HGW-Tenericutes-1]